MEIDTLRMPTLEEALLCCKDRICVNIDKGYDYYDAVNRLTERLGVSMIQTDRPELLIGWLEKTGHHTLK